MQCLQEYVFLHRDEPDLPARTFSRLDFPAPDAPMMAATLPEGTYIGVHHEPDVQLMYEIEYTVEQDLEVNLHFPKCCLRWTCPSR